MVELAPLVAAATASADEVAEYLKSHADEFKQPERRKVQYVSIVPKDMTPKISDAEVEKYYTEHIKEFETPAQVHAVHLLVRVGETGGSEAEDRARAKVAEAIKRAKAGEDLGKLAREMSEDPGSKDKGGDLGWVSKGDMVPQFEEALFAMKKGELSQPVLTPFGFTPCRRSSFVRPRASRSRRWPPRSGTGSPRRAVRRRRGPRRTRCGHRC
jgi:parvulin-like peptidyl-prolyl isomerase